MPIISTNNTPCMECMIFKVHGFGPSEPPLDVRSDITFSNIRPGLWDRIGQYVGTSNAGDSIGSK